MIERAPILLEDITRAINSFEDQKNIIDAIFSEIDFVMNSIPESLIKDDRALTFLAAYYSNKTGSNTFLTIILALSSFLGEDEVDLLLKELVFLNSEDLLIIEDTIKNFRDNNFLYNKFCECVQDAKNLCYKINLNNNNFSTKVGKEFSIFYLLSIVFGKEKFDSNTKILKDCCILTKFKDIKRNSVNINVGNLVFMEERSVFSDRSLFKPLIPKSLMLEISDLSKFSKSAEDAVLLYFEVSISEIENWEIENDWKVLSFKQRINIQNIKRIKYVGDLSFKTKHIENFENINLPFDLSIYDLSNTKIIFPFYNTIERLEKISTIKPNIKPALNTLDKVLDIERECIVRFTKISILKTFKGFGNIINICHQGTFEPFFFFGELNLQKIPSVFSVGIHDGRNWINNDFNISKFYLKEMSDFCLDLIVQKHEISLFIKPFDKNNFNPIMIKSEKLKTNHDFTKSTLYLGSANKNYRSSIMDVDEVFMYHTPQNIGDYLTSEVC